MRIFISGVSGQFKACRDQVASDLRAVGAEVKVQEDFQQHGGTLLEKLQDYITGCDRVIALVGDAYGAEPDRAGLTSQMPRRSYTQWEYFFAQGERLKGERQSAKDTFVYLASPNFVASNAVRESDEEVNLQQKFIETIRRSGKDRNRFGTLDELSRLVLRDGFEMAERLRPAAAGHYPAPFQAPALSDQYVARASLMKSLGETLLAAGDEGASIVTRAALYGIGGAGKSVTAAAFARTPAVRQRFADGVLWVTLGHNANIRQRISDWGRAVRDPAMGPAGYADAIEGTVHLRSALDEQAFLLVVDDVWRADDLAPFLVGGRRSLVLITTRIRDIAVQVGARTFELNEMTPAEAKSLVQKWSGELDGPDRELAESLMREVGYLPLALELMAAQVGKLKSWPEYDERWESQRMRSLKRGRASHGKDDNVWDSFQLSVDTLSEDDRHRYWLLGVFPEDTPFPAHACVALWRCPEEDATELLIDLAGQALLRERVESKPRKFVLHDLLYHFALEHLGNSGRAEANARLVEGYRQMCNCEWHKGPADGYFFEHLAHHFDVGGDYSGLRKLFDDQNWMNSRVVQSGYVYSGYLSDCTIAWRHAHELALTAANDDGQLLDLLRDCVRYSLIHTTLVNLASNTLPELASRALQLGLFTGAQVLEIAGQIQDNLERVRMYAAILGAGQLTAAEDTVTKESAISAAMAIQDPFSVADAFAHIARYVPGEQLGTFLDAALNLDPTRIGALSRALSALAPYLTQDQLERARQSVISIGEKSECVAAIDLLVEYLPANERRPLLQFALDTALAIRDETDRRWALRVLTRHISTDLYSEQRELFISAVLAAPQSVGFNAKYLAVIAPHLRPEELNRALSIVLSWESRDARAAALGAIAPWLDSEQMARVRLHIASMNVIVDRAHLLAAVAEQLPAVDRRHAATEAYNLALSGQVGEFDRAEVLIRLTPLLDPLERDAVVRAATTVRNPTLYAHYLESIARWLSEAQIGGALQAVLAVKEDAARNSALKVLAPYLSADQCRDALESSVKIRDETYQAKALVGLGRNLSADQVGHAFDTARNIINDLEQLDALMGLCPHLPYEDRSTLLEAIFTFDDSLCARGVDAIAPYLMPEEAGRVLERAKAIREAPARARALAALVPRLPESRQREAVDCVIKAQALWHDQAAATLHSICTDTLVRMMMMGNSRLPRTSDKSRCTAVLVPFLSEDERAARLDQLSSVTDDEDRLDLLVSFAPFLPPEKWEWGLAIIRGAKDERERTSTLVEVFPHLPQCLHENAIGVILSSSDPLVGVLGAYGLTECLQLEQEQIENIRRVLPSLIQRIPDKFQKANALSLVGARFIPGVRTEALQTALAIEDPKLRALGLAHIISRLPSQDWYSSLPRIVSLMLDQLWELRWKPRKNILEFCGNELSLCGPVLSPDFARGIASEIHDICRVWRWATV